MKMQSQKHLADVRKASSIHSRNTNAHKPKLPAIFTTNNMEKLFDFSSDGGAVDARVVHWNVGTRKLYKE